jgi:hypothetical protein
MLSFYRQGFFLPGKESYFFFVFAFGGEIMMLKSFAE